MPEKMGLRIPEMLDMAVYGKLKAMYIMGEDPALTDADANHVRKALESLEFLVVQNLFMTETAKYADVFLPAACYAEKDGTFTNTERRVQRVRKAVEPPGAVPPRLADHRRPVGRAGPRAALRLARGDLRRDAHAGAAVRRHHLRAPRRGRPAVALPRRRPPRHAGSCTPGGSRAARACCRASSSRRRPSSADDEYPMLLTTGRMLYHYNIMTRHSAEPRVAAAARARPGQPGRCRRASGWARATWSRVTSPARLDHDARDGHRPVPPGVVFMTFHYKESPVNELTNAAFDPVTKTAEFKVCAVRIEKEQAAEVEPAPAEAAAPVA